MSGAATMNSLGQME